MELPKLETVVDVFADDVSDLPLPSSHRDSLRTPSASSREASPRSAARPEHPPCDAPESLEGREAPARPLLDAFLGAVQSEARSCRARPLPPRGGAQRRCGSRGWGPREQSFSLERPTEAPEDTSGSRWQDTVVAVFRAESSASLARKLPRRRPKRPSTVRVAECPEEIEGREEELPHPRLGQLLWTALRSELAPKRKPRSRRAPALLPDAGQQRDLVAKLAGGDMSDSDT